MGRFKKWRGVIGKPILGLPIFGNAGFWRLKAPKTNMSLMFFRVFGRYCGQISRKESRYCLKLASEQAGIGLRRESVDFPDICKVETLILVILGLD